MTVNERIAKAVGIAPTRSGYCVKHPTEDRICMTGSLHECEQWLMLHDDGPWANWVIRECMDCLPFATSLDAMAIAEATLTDEQRYRYAYELACALSLDLRGDSIGLHLWKAATATAQQRAAAFLTVIEENH